MKADVAEGLIRQVLPAFKVEELLGKGAFGAVFKIKDDLKERAAKFILLNASAGIEQGRVVESGEKIERDFRHIIENYEKIACDEIVTVYDFYKVLPGSGPDQGAIFAIVVMELYPWNLLEYLVDYFKKNRRPIEIDRAVLLMEKVALMIGNLYSKSGFLFEDLKPENILVREQNGDYKVVAGDIGGLKCLSSVTTSGSQVTLAYCAAEVLRKGQRPDQISLIYSFGLLGYFILEGNLPHDNFGVSERIDVIREKGLSFNRNDVPRNIKAVLERCLAFEPGERYRDFNEVVAALSGREIRRESSYGDETVVLGGNETIDLGSLASAGPRPAAPATPIAPARGPGFNPSFPSSLTTPLMGSSRSARTFAASGRAETRRISSDRDEIGKATREVRDLVVKRGNVFRLADENLKVYGDILIEEGGLLNIENAKLFFDESGGILSFGALRAVKSSFTAIDMKKKWKNVTLCPDDSRVSYIRNCSFRLGRGRSWTTLGLQHKLMNDAYSYGGGLLVARAPGKSFSITDSRFTYCTAQVGGGLHVFDSSAEVANCRFENCSAGVSGGGMAVIGSNPTVKSGLFSNCVSARDGGGLFVSSSKATVERCTFDRCTASYLCGGGICLFASRSLISNCKFTRCSAKKDGGGVYCDSKTKAKLAYAAFSSCTPNDSNCK
jgi:serine/threonine protein kinase